MNKSVSADENPSVLDLKSLHQLVGRDEPAIRAVLDKFLVSAEESTESIRKLHSQGDLQGVLSAFHRLKGAAGTVGALELSIVARNGETAAKAAIGNQQGAISSFATSLESLDSAITRLRLAVKELA